MQQGVKQNTATSLREYFYETRKSLSAIKIEIEYYAHH